LLGHLNFTIPEWAVNACKRVTGFKQTVKSTFSNCIGYSTKSEYLIFSQNTFKWNIKHINSKYTVLEADRTKCKFFVCHLIHV